MNAEQREFIYHLQELPKVSEEVLNLLADHRIWLFYGEIGAGKTTFIKSLCSALGVQDATQSPSFALINLYHGLQEGKKINIYHIDLYRLNDLDEALGIGINDYLEGLDYCFIEWPQIIEPILPQGTVKLFFEIVDQSSRKVIIL